MISACHSPRRARGARLLIMLLLHSHWKQLTIMIVYGGKGVAFIPSFLHSFNMLVSAPQLITHAKVYQPRNASNLGSDTDFETRVCPATLRLSCAAFPSRQGCPATLRLSFAAVLLCCLPSLGCRHAPPVLLCCCAALRALGHALRDKGAVMLCWESALLCCSPSLGPCAKGVVCRMRMPNLFAQTWLSKTFSSGSDGGSPTGG